MDRIVKNIDNPTGSKNHKQQIVSKIKIRHTFGMLKRYKIVTKRRYAHEFIQF